MRWIIGDIHGMLTPLEVLLERIAKRDKAPEIIFAGDYVNRGPESRRVVDLLLTLRNTQFLRGNHDDTFDLLLNGKCFVPHSQLTGVVTTFEHFLKYGLEQTLISYGIDWAHIDQVRHHPSAEAIAVLLDPVPMSHREFFRKLPVVHGDDEFFVAHAKWDPDEQSGVPSFAAQLTRSPQLRHEIIWGRYTMTEINCTKPWDRIGFFGHTPVSMYKKDGEMLPIVGDKVILIDTAAALHIDGRLTAWCYEEERYIQVDRDGEWIG